MLSPNTILQDRYRIVRQLGQGGMGAVYEAIDQRVSCVVALKETFVGTSKELRKAFQREAELLANLRHRSLPKVMDFFGDRHGEFLVMEYIAGHDLAKLLELRGIPFPQEQVLKWADELLTLLEYLHSRRPPILHRDIKPANIKLTEQNEIFLIDFGLAKGATGQMRTLAATRSVFGYTPSYASLEQILGQGTDARSDLYGLAATLYHLLAGVPPVSAPIRFSALQDEQPDPLELIEQVNPEASLGVTTVIHRAMSIVRKQRPGDASEMRLALRQALEHTAKRGGVERKEHVIEQSSKHFEEAPPQSSDLEASALPTSDDAQQSGFEDFGQLLDQFEWEQTSLWEDEESKRQVEPTAWNRFVNQHQSGDIVPGKIARFVQFGVLVELDENLEGRCHVNELSDQRVGKPEYLVEIGQTMDFKILRIDDESKKITLSALAVGDRTLCIEVAMPQMGESITEGTITKWLKQVGEYVGLDEPLFEISTDKVDAEIPSPATGILREIRFHEGDTVEVNTTVALLTSSRRSEASQQSKTGAEVEIRRETTNPRYIEVVMPQMGESIAEGTITRWLKQVGEYVDLDEPLFEISTDKVDAEIPSPVAGVLFQIRSKEGETVEVNTTVAVVERRLKPQLT